MNDITFNRFYLKCPECGTIRKVDMSGVPPYFEDRCERVEYFVWCGTLLKYPEHLVKHQQVTKTCEVVDVEIVS